MVLMLMLVASSGLFPQVTGGSRQAQLAMEVSEDSYPNQDNQNFVPVAVDNSHRFTINLENTGDMDEDYALEATFTSATSDWTDDLLVLSEQLITLDQGDLQEVWMEVTAPSTAKLGDQAEMELVVTGVDSSAEFSTTLSVAVKNWTAYITGLETFEVGDFNDYDVTIVNLNDTAAFEASKYPIEVLYPGTLPDWTVSFDPDDGSDPSTWPQNATYDTDIAAGATITMPFRLTLNDNVKASDDTTFIVQANNNDPDHTTNYYLVEGHAEVLPYFAPYVSVDGTSTATVDNTGGTATFDLTVENYGNDDDSFTIAMTDDLPNGNWDATIDKSSTAVLAWKGEGGMESFTVTLEAPAAEVAESEGTATVTVTSDNDATATTARTLTLTVTQVHAISLTDPAEKEQFVLPGVSGEFSLTVNNGGNGPDTVALAITGDPLWIGDPAFSYAAAGITEIEVDADSSEVVLVNVRVPTGTSHKSQQTVIITATSEDGVKTATTLLKVKAAQLFGVVVRNNTNVTTAELDPGQTTFFAVLVTNTGNGIDPTTMTVGGCQELDCRFLEGSNPVAATNIEGQASKVISLKVTAPDGSLEGTYILVNHTLMVTGTSSGPERPDSSFTFTVQVRHYSKTVDPPEPGPNKGLISELPIMFLVLAGLLVALGLRRYRR